MKEITKIVNIDKIEETGEFIAYFEDDKDGGAIVTSKTEKGLKEKFLLAIRVSLIVDSLRSIIDLLRKSSLGKSEIERIAKENKKKIDQIETEMAI